MSYDALGTRAHPTLGLDTFGDVPGSDLAAHPQVIREVLAEGVLADEVGVDYIGLGEHHRVDYAISEPDVILAAIAARTSRIRLGTGVTVLSSDDPVRVYERFATLDALSNGRSSSRSRCLASASKTTTGSSPRNSICSRTCKPRNRFTGREPSASR